MPLQTWQETLIQAQSDGTAVTGTAEGSLLPGQAKFTLPANFLDYAGKTLRIRAAGRISQAGLAGPASRSAHGTVCIFYRTRRDRARCGLPLAPDARPAAEEGPFPS